MIENIHDDPQIHHDRGVQATLTTTIDLPPASGPPSSCHHRRGCFYYNVNMYIQNANMMMSFKLSQTEEDDTLSLSSLADCDIRTCRLNRDKREPHIAHNTTEWEH